MSENPTQCPVCDGPMEDWQSVNRWAKLFTDNGCDHDALKSAVDVLRMRQAQPHKSMESNLWEAIKDYAERARLPPQPTTSINS